MVIKRASADVGLMFKVFNLRRLINIIGKNEFKKYLEGLVFSLFVYRTISSEKIQSKTCIFSSHFNSIKYKSRLKCL